MEQQILTPSDAAKILGIGAARVRQLEREGRIHAQKTLGGNRLFTRDEVDRFAREREQQKASGAA
jgi:excisionase family DNA binding protein